MSPCSRAMDAARTLAVASICLLAPGAVLADAPRGFFSAGKDPNRLAFRPGSPQVTEARNDFSTSAAETVWVGYSATSLDPNKVGTGGKWDFDAGVQGTDSTQSWRFVQVPYRWDDDQYPGPTDRPSWYFDYGNNINRGNHALWKARAAAHRTFRRTGLTGVWHSDNLFTVPINTSGGFSQSISGARSAWCGLRATGDINATQVDEYTGNRFTCDEQYNDVDTFGDGSVRSAYPGYANQWNQLLYRDFDYSGLPIAMSFRVRAHMDPSVALDRNGSAWFSPDPTSAANMVANPADSFAVWVGAPKEVGVYDTNHRWPSDVIDFGVPGAGQPVKIFEVSGDLPRNPANGSDTLISATIPAAAWGPKVRVVFQVHTNRLGSDEATTPGGFNSPDGAVVLDDVNVGGVVSGFELATDIRPRVLLDNNGIDTLISPSTTWISTGRPPSVYGHIHNVNDLPYDDPCGSLDGASGSRVCNLKNNVIVQSDHDAVGHKFRRESDNWAISPTIRLDSGTFDSPNLQGLVGIRADIHHVLLQSDYYTGFDAPEYSGVFLSFGLRYMGTDLSSRQVVDPTVQSWSPIHTIPWIFYYGSPFCVNFDTGRIFDGFFTPTSVDSFQICLENQTRCARFSSTNCGAVDGGYWDNVRCGLLKGSPAGPPLYTISWGLLGDTFPFNETIAPGSAGGPGGSFDTTTALMKDALNLGNYYGGEGVIPGDTLLYWSPWNPRSTLGFDARVDLVFRIWPGPGNYSVLGDRTSPLWKVPSNPGLGTAFATEGPPYSFWGQYMANNGDVGSINDHGQTRWDPQTWNSARMDSAEQNYFPIVSRTDNIGTPVTDTWMGTYHEQDPKFDRLGIARNYCYLVNQAGRVDGSNTCCSPSQCASSFFETWPPSSYDPSLPTSTKEGTKILPDGLFTPGTHIQYFVRRSRATAPGVSLSLCPDTTRVSSQLSLDCSKDQLRFDHVDVLPDLWKDTRFGGSGLACILYVDAADRRGFEPAVRGTLDSLGYGLDNGAERGWKRSLANVNGIDSQSGFVPANLGQVGLAYDKFDVRAAGYQEGDRPGCRYSVYPASLADKQCKQGPTLDMLDFYYNTIIWESGDLRNGTSAIDDGESPSEQSHDSGLILAWLARAAIGNEKAFWGSGDGLAQDMASPPSTESEILLNVMGATWVGDSYFDISWNSVKCALFLPRNVSTIPFAGQGPHVPDEFHSGRRYGIDNSCLYLLDVVQRDGSVGGAVEAARYEEEGDRGNGLPGPFYAAVYRQRDPDAGRFFTTLLDGFALSRLRAWNGANDPTTLLFPLCYNNYAQRSWADDALLAFNRCARSLPLVAVGNQPGLDLNFVRGTFPNPSLAEAAAVQFTLAQPAKVTIRFYSVAGRLVHEQTVNGVAGPNSYRWSGETSTGLRMSPGVYFYRLAAPGVDFQNNNQRMVLIGGP